MSAVSTARFRVPDELAMTCGYCQFTNVEEEHRCLRCGRRLSGGTAAAARPSAEGARVVVRTSGGNALASVAAPEPQMEKPRARRAPEIPMDVAATVDSLPRQSLVHSAQPSLFGAELQSKIIPFDSLERNAGALLAPALPEAAPATVSRIPRTPVQRKTSRVADTQATLDFLPAAKAVPRTLKTNAEAVIFCDAAVAAPTHRATAAVIDLSLVLAAFASTMLIFYYFAQPAALNRGALVLLGAMFAIVTLFYGLLFAIAGTVTPGMRWTHLRVINFDGFPLDSRGSALRLAGSWISLLSGGIGLLWALLDEENLTWHDHISKSFPTLRESTSIVVRQGKITG